MTTVERAVTAPLVRAVPPPEGVPLLNPTSLGTALNDTTWTRADIEALRTDFADVYGGRTCVVTGADGFMGSHLTEALVELGANVVAFVRATSSGALNNIGHRRQQLRVVFADLTDKTSIDYLMRDLAKVDDK